MNSDLTASIKAYVEANIAQERRKLKSMEKAFNKIKEGQTQKCSLNDLEEQDDDSESRNLNDQEERRRRMQYRQQHEASVTLRTSSSLPSLNQSRKSAHGRSLYEHDPIEEEDDYGSTTRTGSFDERTSVWTMNVPGRTGRSSVPFEGQAL